MANATVSNTVVRTDLWVQLPPAAPLDTPAWPRCERCRRTQTVAATSAAAACSTRCFFSNRSDDIRAIFSTACDLIGVESRPSNRYNVSVARRRSVEILDSFIGPKS